MPMDPNDPTVIPQIMGPINPNVVPLPRRIAPKKSPYAAMRANEASPVPAPAQDTGRQQPDTMTDPMSAPPPAMPPLVARGPSPYPGMNSQQYGRESIASGDFGQTAGRDRSQNVYQSPGEYAEHQQEVLNSPIMQKLAASVDEMKGLRQSVLETMKPQTDLSPLMALADYMARGQGTAQKGYRRPASFEETAANIQGLLQAQNKDESTLANAALEQTGGLKSGQEGANTKTEASQGQKEGFNIPHPPFMNPFTMAQSYGNDYAKNPTVKDANDEVAGANEMKELLKNPNWLADNALKGQMVRNLGVNRITQGELTAFGGGSPDLLNRATNAITKATTGQTLSQSDIHDIDQFADARMRAALLKRDQAHQAMNQGLGAFLPPGLSDRLNRAGDVQPATPPPAAGDAAKRQDVIRQQIMQMMKGMK